MSIRKELERAHNIAQKALGPLALAIVRGKVSSKALADMSFELRSASAILGQLSEDMAKEKKSG